MKTSFITAVIAIIVLAAIGLLSSCVAVSSAITGEPIATTPVQRPGGPPFEVATSDVIRAEHAPPTTAWGLYDAGAAAARLGDAIDLGKSSSSK